MHKIKLLHQKPVMRGKVNLLVKAAIGPGHRCGIGHQLVIALDHVAQHAHLFFGGVTRGKIGGKPFQLCADNIKFRKLIVIKRGYDQATTIAGQQRLCFQPLQRLSDRGSGYAETFGKIAFDKPVAGLVGAHVDRFENKRVGVFLRRGYGHRGLNPYICHKTRQYSGTTPRIKPRPESVFMPLSRARKTAPMPKQDFAHVTDWVFDLDNTLYPPAARLFDQVDERMTVFVMDQLRVDRAEAGLLRDRYWQQHGTTLAGLMAEHDLDPGPFLEVVHDISLDHLDPDADLAARIKALPGRKIVYTNGTASYAARVVERRGLAGVFDGLYGVENAGFRPKPDRVAFDRVFRLGGVTPGRAAMFEDEPRNLAAPHEMGMRTVHVAPDAHVADHIHHHTDDLAGFLARLV